MCNQKVTHKCCLDNILLCCTILIFMLFFLYLNTKRSGVISIIVVMMVLSCIMFAIRLEDYGCPNIFKKIAICCKDELCNYDEEEENE
jgi:hypothetical protein